MKETAGTFLWTRVQTQTVIYATQLWVVTNISMEFLNSFLRHHFATKPVMASQNVGCFLRLNY